MHRKTFAFTLLLVAFLQIHAQIGRDWGVERTSYTDPESGVEVWEMTASDKGAANNLYFHFSNFTADNRHLIFTSTRTGSSELFRAEVDSGRIIQLTGGQGISASTACPDPTNPARIYLMQGARVLALNINTFETRVVGEVPKPHLGGFQQPTLSRDGRWMTLTRQRDASNWEIGLMNTENGEYRTVISQGFRIGHVQHSPTDALIFYVWETGGYAPQRTWLVNTDGSGNRPFYARTASTNWFTPLKEWVTHEAWIKQTGEMTMINDKLGVMIVNPDGSSRLIHEGHYWHAAARPDGKFLVIDDMQGRLWLLETATGNRRLLATGIRNTIRTVHAHSSFDHQGRYVQFHTGRRHETIAIIDLEKLPNLNWTR